AIGGAVFSRFWSCASGFEQGRLGLLLYCRAEGIWEREAPLDLRTPPSVRWRSSCARVDPMPARSRRLALSRGASRTLLPLPRGDQRATERRLHERQPRWNNNGGQRTDAGSLAPAHLAVERSGRCKVLE